MKPGLRSHRSRRNGFLPGGGTLLGFFAVVALLAVFVSACGGNGDDGDNEPGSEPATTGTAEAPGPTGAGGAAGATGATGPTAATGSTGAPERTGGTTGAEPTGSTGEGPGSSAPAELADYTGLQSFRWDVTLSGAGSFIGSAGIPSVPGGDLNQLTATGAYIAPDQAQVEINMAGFAYKQTIKGNEQWTSIAGVNAGPIPATDSAESLIYVSAFVDPSTVVDGSSMQCGGSENVNGVQAIRCETTEMVNQQIVAGLAGSDAQASEASFMLWVAEEGNYVVRYDFSASGTAEGQSFEWSFVANITDVNNVSSIEP